MIVSTAIVETVRGRTLHVALAESLMIVLASYFATRRVVDLPPDVLEKLEQDGQLPSERHPLYLPRFSIRVIILISFAGLAGYLYQRGELFTEKALATYVPPAASRTRRRCATSEASNQVHTPSPLPIAHETPGPIATNVPARTATVAG